ncbi:MAG: hypothetical protein K2X77_18710 [Candidatus Obscuribacterales bacterium]|jgi:hypothetical protein|nr:hypothetical protein [Candidatus Obscuribacterales bacterium]
MSPWNHNYKAGQTVTVKIIKPVPKGYEVVIVKDNYKGFLSTDDQMKLGTDVLVRISRVVGRQLEFSPLASASKDRKADLSQSKTNWQEIAAQGLDGSVVPSAQQLQQQFVPPPQPVKHSRRATDLILPPLSEPFETRIEQVEDLLWLVTDMEGGMRTGCIKTTCNDKKSRGVVVLYKGRAVGCLYSSERQKDPLSIENSLQMTLADCHTPGTRMLRYWLPDELALSIAALFLGEPIQRSDDWNAPDYFDYIFNWFTGNKQTACIAVAGCIFTFIHTGNFVGAFFVEDQQFVKDINAVRNLLQQNPQASVDASVLPPERYAPPVRLGLSLSMYMPK